jgi:metaxin
MEVPPIIRKFCSYFPLHTHEGDEVGSAPNSPTLWVSPPAVPSPRLSGDIECLKWQTYLVLRKVPAVRFRYDIQPDGGVGGVLPSLHLPNGDFLSPSRIPSWANDALKQSIDGLEGYASIALRDESRAWVSLFEGVIHSALVSCHTDSPYDSA